MPAAVVDGQETSELAATLRRAARREALDALRPELERAAGLDAEIRAARAENTQLSLEIAVRRLLGASHYQDVMWRLYGDRFELIDGHLQIKGEPGASVRDAARTMIAENRAVAEHVFRDLTQPVGG
jgi:hypothetical protein